MHPRKVDLVKVAKVEGKIDPLQEEEVEEEEEMNKEEEELKRRKIDVTIVISMDTMRGKAY